MKFTRETINTLAVFTSIPSLSHFLSAYLTDITGNWGVSGLISLLFYCALNFSVLYYIFQSQEPHA